MATQQKAKSRSGGSSRSGAAKSGRRASEKTEKYRFAQNVAGEGTAAEREYEAYATDHRGDPRGDPDVLLDVPVVKVDSIHLEVDDLSAHVALKTKVLDLVRLNAGVDVQLGKLRIDVKGVEAQALLKVRLDHVTAIVDRVLTTLDRNPELIESLGRTVEHVGRGTGHALGETGDAVESVGEGGGQAVGDVGQGAGQTLGELEGVVSGALQQGDGGDSGGSATDIAKLATKIVAQQIKAAAADEARELGLAATRKALEVGERRKQRKSEELNATEAAMREADELGVDVEDVEGTGPEGRVTIRDVRQAQED